LLLAYISGALNNAGDLAAARALYERLAAACISAGWDAYVPHQHADPERDAALSNRDVADRDLAAIERADLLVVSLGVPSLGVGAEVAIALASGKRVLALAPEGERVSRFLLGLLDRHPAQAMCFRYRSVDDACGWLTGALEKSL
jgi:nucleoside 2-deoxyribosyltransferase